jgi:acyl carrier protein
MQRVLEHGTPGRLLHVYGPTEVTTFATYEPVEGVARGVPVPIGKPIGNTLAYVVDRELRLQPPYAAGELLLGGDGIALGYLERPQLNTERFIPDPFRGGGTLYRTGDIVRRLPDGRLEFIGRRDQQIKLRGFRIELGEIEAALRDFPQCEQALVVLHEEACSEQRRLVAYLAMPSAPTHADLALRRHLKQRLPDYMIPSAFVILERMPLNANGKIDRKALPAPVRGGTGFGKAFVAPVGALEQQLADIWARVLGVAQIGRNDNFFELGGHSLSASTAIGQIRAALRVDMPLPLFFQCPSLQALAEEVQRLQASSPPPSSGIARVARTAVQPPSGDV